MKDNVAEVGTSYFCGGLIFSYNNNTNIDSFEGHMWLKIIPQDDLKTMTIKMISKLWLCPKGSQGA